MPVNPPWTILLVTVLTPESAVPLFPQIMLLRTLEVPEALLMTLPEFPVLRVKVLLMTLEVLPVL